MIRYLSIFGKLVLSYDVTDASCALANDGGAIVTVSGGNGNNTFQWSDPIQRPRTL
ncbi:MAG: SprB repeat-containing protein [Saprospiraceae bacterium]